MRCFYHEIVDAVAICKNCNRGVCHECAIEFANGVACKNRCEAEVEAVNQMIDRSKTSHQKTSSAYSRNAVVYLMFAVVFGVWGVSELTARPLVGWLMALLAIIFLVAAFFSYSTSRKYMQPESDKRT
jgi:quinol-cytochrome oxidoreductase complex cytochrome b subunit